MNHVERKFYTRMKKTKSVSLATRANTVDQMVTLVESMGPLYNPVNPALTLAALREAQTNVYQAHDEYEASSAALLQAQVACKKAFAQVKERMSRLMNELRSQDLPVEVVDRIKALVKLQRRVKVGAEVTPVAATAPATTEAVALPERVLRRRAGRVRVKESVGRIANVLATTPGFKSATPDLDAKALDKLKEELDNAMHTLNDAEVQQARLSARLYELWNDEANGMALRMRQAKAHVLAVDTKKHFKAVRKLTVRRLRSA